MPPSGFGSVAPIGSAPLRREAPRTSSSLTWRSAAIPEPSKPQKKAEAKAAASAALSPALDAYDKELESRGIVKRKEVISALRRELRDRLGKETDVRTIALRHVVERIKAIARERPGAAGYFRKAITGFLAWLAQRRRDRHFTTGWLPQATSLARAQRLEQAGRALEDHEIAGLWRATATPFGLFVRLCL